MDASHSAFALRHPPAHAEVLFAALAAARLPMLLTDPAADDHPIVFANRAICELTGYEPNDLLGRNCRMLQGPETDRNTVEQMRRAIAANADIAVEVLNYRRDGTPFWNALFISPVLGRDGRARFFLSSQLDVTRRHEAERALAHARYLDGLGGLAGGIAHEFNNLLTVIRGNLEPLLRDTDDPRHHRRLRRLELATVRAAELTRSMVAFARKQRLAADTLDLAALLTARRAELAAVLGEHFTLACELAQGEACVRADPGQLEGMLHNLLRNAREAHGDDPRPGHVTLRLERVAALQADEVVLHVQDDGPGMPPEIAARAIDPFFTSKAPGQGSGLGLSMAFGFMRQSGGRLELATREGQGTTIRLIFPAVSDSKLPDALGEETVLVVDEDPEPRQFAAAALSDLGYSVLQAASPAAALVRLSNGLRIDLMLTDKLLTGMSGALLAARARRLRPGLPVLFSSFYARAEDCDLLPKPFRPRQLALAVRRMLDAAAGADQRR